LTAPSWTPEPGSDATLEENWLFRLRRERFRSKATKRSHDYYVIHLADAVNVIAITPDRRLVLVRQFRAGSGRDSLETPGGLLNPGEDPLTAGARELREETGYVGDPPRSLGTVWSNPSLLSSKITTILIENAHPIAATAFDDHEELQLELVPETAIPTMLDDGRIDHALVVLGLFAWMASGNGSRHG
jgi:8-oxo-dGTP pyrophosphatase MutT (NUDIX family)